MNFIQAIRPLTFQLHSGECQRRKKRSFDDIINEMSSRRLDSPLLQLSESADAPPIRRLYVDPDDGKGKTLLLDITNLGSQIRMEAASMLHLDGTPFLDGVWDVKADGTSFREGATRRIEIHVDFPHGVPDYIHERSDRILQLVFVVHDYSNPHNVHGLSPYIIEILLQPVEDDNDERDLLNSQERDLLSISESHSSGSSMDICTASSSTSAPEVISLSSRVAREVYGKEKCVICNQPARVSRLVKGPIYLCDQHDDEVYFP